MHHSDYSWIFLLRNGLRSMGLLGSYWVGSHSYCVGEWGCQLAARYYPVCAIMAGLLYPPMLMMKKANVFRRVIASAQLEIARQTEHSASLVPVHRTKILLYLLDRQSKWSTQLDYGITVGLFFPSCKSSKSIYCQQIWASLVNFKNITNFTMRTALLSHKSMNNTSWMSPSCKLDILYSRQKKKK